MTAKTAQPVRSTPNDMDDRPPLLSGDHLTREEFHRRYLLYPEIKHAELINGVVYMASPLRLRSHGGPDFLVASWLGVYAAGTPGVHGASNATVILSAHDEVQPDQMLWLDRQVGSRSVVTDDDYFMGAPDLIVEVAGSSAGHDLGVKRQAYEAAGVQEYVVVLPVETQVVWFILDKDRYRQLEPAPDGTLRSRVLPGLWLSPAALLAGDSAGVLQTVAMGLASAEHAAFVSALGAAGGGSQ
jgi:Uma2 family endonuclease